MNRNEINTIDVIAIERQAREMQARALADMVRALLRGIAGRLGRGAAAHTA